MLGFGKKKRQEHMEREQQQLVADFDTCIASGVVPIVEVDSSGKPVFIKLQNVALYELKTQRTYMSTRIRKTGGRIGTSYASEGWVQADTGVLSATSKEISFFGGKRTLQAPNKKIAMLTSLFGGRGDLMGVQVHISSRKHSVIFQLPNPVYYRNVMHFAMNLEPHWLATEVDGKPAVVNTNKFKPE